MLRKLFAGIFTLIGGAAGYGIFVFLRYLINLSGVTDEALILSETEEFWMGIVFVIIFGIIFFKLTPAIKNQSKKAAINIESELQRVPTSDLLGGTLGLVIGLVIAYLISGIYESFHLTWLEISLEVITYLVFAFLGITVATHKFSDVIKVMSISRASSSSSGKKSKISGATPKILDTSVIIDGRILDIMRTGFIEGNIVIPEFVLVELRHIADSSDGLKRQRGRRGLDILNKIQTEYGIEIYNCDQEKTLEEIPEVDVKLLKLAQMMNGKVVTNDFNLNKVAAIKGVEVLNINELANTLKPIVLPGEEMNLFLAKEGKENNQAVAYLDDGTMIVIEEGRRYIGQTIKVIVTSVLQTSAGRMIFGKPKK